MDYYIIECTAEGCVAEFYLNDIPIALRGLERGNAFAGPVNQYVTQGINHLECAIQPGPDPSCALTGENGIRKKEPWPENAHVSMAMAIYPHGAVIGGPDRKEITSFSFSPEKGTQVFTPRIEGTSFQEDQGAGRREWENAETVTLDDETTKGLTGIVNRLHGSMIVGDYKPLMDLSEKKCRDIDRAYEKKPGTTAGEMMILRGDPTRDPHWGMEIIKPDQVLFRLCGKNRLVECLNRDWKPVLREIPDKEGSIVFYPLLLCFLDGKWQIAI